MEFIGLIGVLGFLIFLLFIGIPVAFAMIIVGVGLLYIEKGTQLLDMAVWSSWNTTNSYVLGALPLFILMGEFLAGSGLAARLYKSLTSWIYWLPGKCLQSNIAATSIFAAISGSSVATAATFAKISINPLIELKYSRKHLYGSIAAGGALGILIPPSIDLILYGAMTHTSIPKLFGAGVLPGLTLSVLFSIAIIIMAILKPNIAPDIPSEQRTWHSRLSGLKVILPIVIIVIAVLGGIYIGLYSPNEAAAVGALGTLLLAVGSGTFSVKWFFERLISAARTTAWITFILIGADILSFGLGQSGIARQSLAAIEALNLSPLGFIILLIGYYAIMGCFVEGLALMLLTLAIVFPMVKAIGLNPIWFGVIMIVMNETSLLTPPVGLNLFVISGVANDSVLEAAKGVLPFYICLIILLILLIAFPNLALLIPSIM